MSKREPHSVNGKLQGVWCETASGHRFYLAHRVNKQLHRVRNAWCIDLAILEKCRAQGITAVGVVRREGKKKLVWMTHVEDFFDTVNSFPYFTTCRQRGLPLNKFRIDPTKSAAFIESAVKMR